MNTILQPDGRPQPRTHVDTAEYLTKESLDWLNAFDPIPPGTAAVIRDFWRQDFYACQRCGRINRGFLIPTNLPENWKCDCSPAE